MLFLTKWFGVTDSDDQRSLEEEEARTREIAERILLLQANAAAKQRRPLCRGTHAKGVVARAQFEVFDLAAGRDPALAVRLRKGIFARPGVYPATARFANADSHINPDGKADVRSLSFSVDLTCGGTVASGFGVDRQDFSMQNATTLPLNDAQAFLAIMKLLTASSPLKGLLSLSLRDQLRVARALVLTELQERQPLTPYQRLRYWSTVPFRHGPADVVKQSATPSPSNPSRPLQKADSNALQDELVRHLDVDATMSNFDFGLQFLDAAKMTYWGSRLDANFWIENASVAWKEAQAPFHWVARLTLERGSQSSRDAGEAAYFDVTGNAASDSAPVGSINRARWSGEAASRRARTRI